jgi:hypothetical protein
VTVACFGGFILIGDPKEVRLMKTRARADGRAVQHENIIYDEAKYHISFY